MFCTAKYFICFNPNSLETMKTSNPHCVPAILKTAALAAILAVPATSFAAGSYSADLRAWERSLPSNGGIAQYEDSSDGYSDEASDYDYSGYSDYESLGLSPWKYSVETEIYSASANKDALYGTSADLLGFNIKFVMNKALNENFSYDFFLLGGAAYGLSEYETSRGWWYYWSEYGVYFSEISVGANIRWNVSENFSVYAGARFGGSMLYVEDANYDSEAGFGLAYGVGFGLQWSFNRHHALTLGYAFVGSTAESEVNTFGGEKITVEKQSYNTFSLGYKYSF